MTKETEFTWKAPGIFHTPAGSKPGMSYVLSVVPFDGGFQVMCTCKGAQHRGPDTCKHSKELRHLGLARREAEKMVGPHTVTVYDDVPATNFQVRCVCGWLSNIASLDRRYAEESAQKHRDAHDPVKRAEVASRLFSVL